MTRFLLRRILASLSTIVIVTVFVFGVIRLAPGDPAMLIAGDAASPETLARIRAEWGLDQPLIVQYFVWTGNVLRGDLGVSLMTGEPVLSALWRHFAVTLQLVLLAFAVSALLAAPLGMIAGWRRKTSLDGFIVGAATLLTSAPSFWIAMLLVMVFGSWLGWLPTLGFVPVYENPAEWFAHIVMPTASLVCVELAILTRLMRASVIEVLEQDYVLFARSRGLPEKMIAMRHVLKNALAPFVTMLGLVLSSLLSGTVIIESVFAVPGLGRYMIDAIYARDYPVIQGVLLFVVVIYSLVNIVVDLIYPALDPRVREA